MRKLIAVLALGSGIALVLAGCLTIAPRSETSHLTIVATGFLKGNLYPHQRHYSMGRSRTLGGFAHLVSRVREIITDRGPKGGVLLVDLGGHLSGSAESYASSGKIVVDMMNHLPYAAALVSNLEFTYGTQVLGARVSQARFPYVATNLGFASDDLARRVRREVTVEVGGRRVAILGIAPLELHRICAPEAVAGVTVDPDLSRVLADAARAKASGADLVVALSKISVAGAPQALRDAIASSSIDILVGIDYERAGEDVERWGNTLVTGIPGDNRGSRIKIVDLALRPGTRLVAESSVESIAPEVAAADPEVAAELADYERQVLGPLARTVATARTWLSRAYKAESTLGNLITDAMREATGAPIALINSGAIQDDLVPGDVTHRDLFRVIPFDNALVTIRVSGRAIEKAFRETLERGSHYQVSGMSYAAAEASTQGARLVNLKAAGAPLDPEATYTVALTDYILKHTRAFDGAKAAAHGNLRDALAELLARRRGPIDGRIEGRLAFERAPLFKDLHRP